MMEKPSFEQPKQEIEQKGLGVERINDPERAHLMASLENLAYEQAEAYRHYLEKPEDNLVEETAQFSAWKVFGCSPADIKTFGAENARIAGEKYDIEKIVQGYEERKSRFGLIKEQVKSVLNITASQIGFVFSDLMASRDSNKIMKLHRFFKNFDLESYRFFVANEARLNLNKGGRKEYIADALDALAKESLLKAEGYLSPEAPEEKEKEEEKEIDTTPKLSEVTAEPQEEHWGLGGEESQNENEVREKDDVVTDTFDWAYKKYEEYLSLSQEEKQKQSYFFRNLEKQGVRLEDLKDQEKAVSEWLGRLMVYGKRLENLTEDELKKEMKFSFLTSVTKQIIEDDKQKSGTEILLDLGTSLFKTYKAARELEKRKGS